jgi:broad specificity phosphatase PhoE
LKEQFPEDPERFFRERSPDPPLTDRGEDQARLVAERLKAEDPEIDEIWTSYLSRALATAAELRKANPQAIVRAMKSIAEVGGCYHYCLERESFVGLPGTSNAQLRIEYPDFCADDSCDEGWYRGATKETVDEAALRAKELLQRMEEEVWRPSAGARSVVVVTHGDFFAVVLREMCETILRHQKIPEPPPLRHSTSNNWIGNASVTRVDAIASEAGLQWKLVYSGDDSHLQLAR